MYCNDNEGYFPTCAMGTGGSYIPFPEDWIHWQANRDINNSAIARYVGQGEKLKNLLRCPADTLEGRKARYTGAEGPYLYSYHISATTAINVGPCGPPAYRSKVTQWRAPAEKILLTEASEIWLMQPATDYASPLTQRHGSAVFHGNVPGFPQLLKGVRNGSNVSTMFLDGHVQGIDQDFAFDIRRWRMNAR